MIKMLHGYFDSLLIVFMKINLASSYATDDHNRVILKLKDGPHSDYINASYVKVCVRVKVIYRSVPEKV